MAKGRKKSLGSAAVPGDVAVAFLRGINVGGKNKLPMKALAAMFSDAGAAAVQTYIQSGNVIFRAPPALVAQLPAAITAAIADGYGYRVPVIVRTAAELMQISRSNPFLPAAEERALHVVFLAAEPEPAAAAALDPDRSPPDRFTVGGREIYLCCPKGLARTKLTNQYFDAALGTTSTIRSWQTVLKLAELARGR